MDKEIATITITFQTQALFFFALVKLRLNFFPAVPILSLISSVVSSPNTKKLFLQLSV